MQQIIKAGQNQKNNWNKKVILNPPVKEVKNH